MHEGDEEKGQMLIERADLLALLRARNPWYVTVRVLYDFKVMPLDWVLRNLHTCWPARTTFVEVAKEVLQGVSPATDMNKLASLAADFNDHPVLVLCFTHRDLKRIWPVRYPPTSGPPDDALIVEDGNHRLTALALRLKRAQPVNTSHVGVFTAHL